MRDFGVKRMVFRVFALCVCFFLAGATHVVAHDETAGWGGAFKEKVGLSDEQYMQLMQYKQQADEQGKAATAAIEAVRELLIADPEADISERATEIEAMLAKQAEDGQLFFREFSLGLTDAQRAKWVDHTLKRKRKKSEGKLPKKE